VDTFQRLTDDEKGDIVSQAIEALQTEIEQVWAEEAGVIIMRKPGDNVLSKAVAQEPIVPPV
jgi:hypothetical protein